MLQEKSFESGRAFRITADIYVGGWRGFKHHTVVVRTPNSRYDTFRPAIVATEGIQGQPQMTFETEQEAQTWLNDHRNLFGDNFSDWRVGRTRSYYTCYKVPLEDGSECWLSVFQFPSQGSEEWDRLVRLYPNYFRVGPGFFTEGINRNFTTDEQIDQIMKSDMSEEEKCRRLFDRPLERVLEYGKFSFISPSYDYSSSSEKRDEAKLKCENSKQANDIRVCTLLVLGNISEPFTLTESYEFYVLGEHNDRYRRDSSSICHALNWWRYIKDVVEAWEEACGTEPRKLGFFTETLYQNNIRINIEVGDEFITNKSEVIDRLNRAGLHFWLGDYTKYKITRFTFDNDGNLLCCGDYWNLDEEDGHVHWRGSWDEGDRISVEDIEGQINIPGAILEFNGKEVAKQKLGFFTEGVLKNATDDQVIDIMEDESLSNEEKCKKLFNGRDQDYLWETCFRNCNFYNSAAEDCENCEVRTIFIKDNFDEQLMTLEQSYQYYVKGGRSKTVTPSAWWEDIVSVYKSLEKSDPEKFSKRDFNLGFFSEELSLIESYNVPPEDIKRVVIKYVKENGYTRGEWNGRYPTESPTVHSINNILRQVEDKEPFKCTPEELIEFNNWVANVQPEGTQADWMRRCIDTWNKQDSLDKEDLRNLVSFVSYKLSNDAYNRRQEQKRQAELQHQQHVDSETNTWAGQIGDTVSFTVDQAKTFFSAYGVIWNVTGTDGRTYTWYEEKETEHGDRVTGKVKALSEFRGIKQTRLVHVEISKQNLGFFN